MIVTIRKIAAVAALVVGIGVVPVVAPAYMGEDSAQMDHDGKRFKKFSAGLGLTAEQKATAKEIFKKNRPLVEPLLKQLAAERKALHDLIQADTVDEAAIRAQSAKMAAVGADLAVQRAYGSQEFRKILSAEQLQKLKALQARRDSMRHKGRPQPIQ